MPGDDLGRKLDVLHATFGDHGVPRAVEDLPPDSWDKVPGLASAPEKHPLWQRILDELADVGLDSYGDLETVPLLHFLSQYPVTAYTYAVSPQLSRGERPSLAKLHDLARQGYQRTVNLCAETVGGDTLLIARAGLAGRLETVHVPIVDMHDPTVPQVVQLRAFIQEFAAQLQAHAQARGQQRADSAAGLGRYPLKPLGSVRATPAEREATLGAVARTERGGVE